MDILATLKDRRETLGITQEALANLSGVSLRTIKKCESQKNNPTINTLNNLCEVLGLEIYIKPKDV